jgi:hypothetical protein
MEIEVEGPMGSTFLHHTIHFHIAIDFTDLKHQFDIKNLVQKAKMYTNIN